MVKKAHIDALNYCQGKLARNASPHLDCSLGSAFGRWAVAPHSNTKLPVRQIWFAEPPSNCTPSLDLTGSPELASAIIRGRRFFVLGDSVARDMVIALQLAVVPRDTAGNPVLALQSREEAKADCHKYIAREMACAFELGNEANAHFHWFQWWSLRSHSHSLTTNQNQEADMCCDASAAGGSLKNCLFKFTASAKSRDVLVLRAGLNYLLFESELQAAQGIEWDAVLERDLREFLSALSFPGIVIFYLLHPTLAEGQVPNKCVGDGNWDTVMWQIARKSARANAIMEPLILAAGFQVINPWKHVSFKLMATDFKDCVHPGPILQEAAANLLLNIIQSVE